MAYFPIRWNRFTEFAAQSLVAVTRGVRSIWIIAPWPSEARVGKFAMPALITGGYAASIPNGKHGEDIADFIMEFLWTVAQQRLAVVPGLDSRTVPELANAMEHIHDVIGL